MNAGWISVLRERAGSVSPWPRLPLLVLMGFWALRYLADPGYQSLISGLNFGIHELGHVVFTAFGEFVHFLGGTLLQCLAPVVAMVLFLRQRDDFGVFFALGWLGTNLFGVAHYMADATAQALPLLGVGTGEPRHDWNYLLGKVGLLGSEAGLSAFVRVLGGGCFALSLVGGSLVLYLRLAPERRAKELPSRYRRIG